MDIQAYKDEIILKLTGYVLDSELDDPTLEKIINSAFREVQRYIDSTRLATIPFSRCLDLSECKVAAVKAVYRTGSYNSGQYYKSSIVDPFYAQFQVMGGVDGYSNINNWTYNYAAYNTMLQLRNTLSTDLAFRFDRHSNRLYININGEEPDKITVEYVPRYDDVSEIISDYWIDMIVKLSSALAKQIVGRIRSKYTQSNALWTLDGATLLSEANEELNSLRTELKENSNLMYPID